MLNATALIAIACMIANKGHVDTSSIESQLSGEEKAQVQNYLGSADCSKLPNIVEDRIDDTHQQVRSGTILHNIDDGSEPCRDCG